METNNTAVIDYGKFKKFISCKIVEAQEMTSGDYNALKNYSIIDNEGPDTPGYLVKYPSNYFSWCPKEEFEKYNYQMTDQIDKRIMMDDVSNFVEKEVVPNLYSGDGECVIAKTITGLSCPIPGGSDNDYHMQKFNKNVLMALEFILKWAINGLIRK